MSLQQCVTISMEGMWTVPASFVPGAVWMPARYKSYCNDDMLEIFLQEDSGGPLMCQQKGRYLLVGIISSGKGCAEFRYWSVLTVECFF